MIETQQKIFYTAKNDKVFKTILGNEDNKDLLKKFLERILDKTIEDITYLKNELTINYPKEKRKTVDLLVKTNNEYIHIELNNGYSNYLHMRNFCYLANLYSKKTKVGKNYNIKEKFIQINFTYKNIIKSEVSSLSNKAYKNISNIPFASTIQDITSIPLNLKDNTIIYMHIESSAGKKFLGYADKDLNIIPSYQTFEKIPVSLRVENNSLIFTNNYYSTQGLSYTVFKVVVCNIDEWENIMS